ncbi:monocarboxylate transporter 7-like, partial [Mercenaria mercenaria]|uniref:monocarboxylate transporter 7-like n=1 Tax=Mercenaria mercenaria TaxID=6596 RepID=UPI00234E8272
MIRKGFLVTACLFIHMLSPGLSVSFGILYREMRLEFGTSHTEAAWIASIFNGLLGFVGIPLSLVANKIGERWPTVCGSLLLALGMLTSMFAKKTSIMYVTYGLLAGSGAGMIDFCANTHLVANFNDKWRPVAATVTNAGVPLSALILPPILTIVIEQFDLKKALLFLACLSLLGVPAGLCFYPQKLTDISQSESIT